MNGRSDIVDAEYADFFGDVLQAHHATSTEGFTKDKFEHAMLRAMTAQKRAAALARLGGRSRNAADYEDGRVRYENLARSPGFSSGMERLIDVASRDQVALLCAEKEPLDCHRAILVARELDRLGVAVQHIHADGHLETQDSAMSRLLEIHHIQELSLFNTRAQLIEEACALQERRIAYVDPGMRAAFVVDTP